MLRKKKDNSEYEIDRELTWKFAIKKNAEYQERIAKLEEENKNLTKCNLNLQEHIDKVEEENKKLKEGNELLKQCLDKLMFDADIVNVKIHWELWDYVYVRSDKQFKLNVKD